MAELSEGIAPETAGHTAVPTEAPARFARDLPKENTGTGQKPDQEIRDGHQRR